MLWQSGVPSADNGRIYGDLPVQIYDWDNDGWNDVLYVKQANYVEPPYDGNGVRERADALRGRRHADCPLRPDRKGEGTLGPAGTRGRLFSVRRSHRPSTTRRSGREGPLLEHVGRFARGQVLWQWSGSTGHFPTIADVDGDGCDEVFVGFALIDHDGTVLFSSDPQGAHQDACYIVKPIGRSVAFAVRQRGLHCLMSTEPICGRTPMGECQHVVAGRFRTDSEMQFISIDRTPVATHRRDENAWAILYLFDLNGKVLWRQQQEKGAWAIAPLAVRWSGAEAPQDILVYGHGPGRPVVIYRGDGTVDTLPLG